MDLRAFIPKYIKHSKDQYKYTFTVFTPVYNSAATINRVHNALKAQTFQDFEWLIINDGSTDSSDTEINKLKLESHLNIRYINNTKNKHKMFCFLQAIKEANGKFLLTFDADDSCKNTALEVLNNEYKSIPKKIKDQVCAVTGLCVDENNNLVGTKFPKTPLYSDSFKSYTQLKVKGEKWGFTKTNILKGILYSHEFTSNGFMSEGIIWNLLAKEGYKTKYINIPLRVYYTNTANSISKSHKEKIALGRTVNFITNFNWFFNSNFYKSPLFFLKNSYFLVEYALHAKLELKDILKAIDSFFIKLITIKLWILKKFIFK